MTGNSGAKKPLLEVKGLKKYFPITKGLLKKTVGHVKAVDDVSFSIDRGATLGLVGESGCGKTTTGRCIIRLIEPTAGEIVFTPDENGESITVDNRTIASIRKQVQIIFQDPFSSLNPRMSVLSIISEPMLTHGIKSLSERQDRVEFLLKAVGLSPSHMKRFPHEFSGGQRQRIGIARALALNPKLVICDEPVSALDVSVQAQVINLLEDLQEQFGLTYLFIAHDLSVVQHISTKVAVMYLGKIVELSDVDTLFEQPLHPYTEALFSAIPIPDPTMQFEQIILEGDVPSPSNPPPGCNFHPRCRYAQDICSKEEPRLVDLGGGRCAACHFAKTLSLQGVSMEAAASR